ncbi:MAG: hypothetical protein QE279_02785 [Rhodoferax sp.]|nr:hypothetical protein [Rhodoferax sp.]
MSNEKILQPAMDHCGLQFFMDAMSRSNCFLEYGCGGSTSYAANVAGVKSILSVDTSKPWIDKVSESLSRSDVKLVIKHCDFGDVHQWGVPVSRAKSADFWRYMVAPWGAAKQYNLIPDAILIDGRFRVASFLYSLLSARVGTLLMFDDYLDRERYFVVEKYCKLREKHGRMGVFYADHNYSVPDLVATIAEYSTNWA